MENVIKDIITNKNMDLKFREKVVDSAHNQALNNALGLIGLKVEDRVLYEAETNEPLNLINHKWVRANGDEVSYQDYAYISTDITAVDIVDIEVSKGEETPLKLKVYLHDGEINSIESKTTHEDLKANSQLCDNSYGFDKAYINYECHKDGYDLEINGFSEGACYVKKVNTSIDGGSYVHESVLKGGPMDGDSLFYQPSDGHIEISYGDNSLDVPVKESDDTSLYLFDKISNDQRNKTAKEFALDCIANIAPKVKEAIERISTKQKILLCATKDHNFNFSKKSIIDEAFLRTQNERFDIRNVGQTKTF